MNFDEANWIGVHRLVDAKTVEQFEEGKFCYESPSAKV